MGWAGIDLHRTRRLDSDEVTVLDGIPTTTLARTLIDMAGIAGLDALERLVHEAEVLRLLDVHEVQAAMGRAAGRRGVGALRAVIAQPSPGSTRSELERRFLALCRRGRLPRPRLNLHIEVGDRLVEVDALWPEARLVVELDGAAVHGTRRAFEADRAAISRSPPWATSSSVSPGNALRGTVTACSTSCGGS